ncbi:unnamed protein product [Amoebophrya sp. A25]|nr:unnamed protein product [Amoebophrya sp. A25]|eukprot:GSA25T00005831001.1
MAQQQLVIANIPTSLKQSDESSKCKDEQYFLVLYQDEKLSSFSFLEETESIPTSRNDLMKAYSKKILHISLCFKNHDYATCITCN